MLTMCQAAGVRAGQRCESEAQQQAFSRAWTAVMDAGSKRLREQVC